jgi:hypothetical protein
MDICTEVVPADVRFGDGTRVACHLHPPGSPGSQPEAGPVEPGEPAGSAPSVAADPPGDGSPR